MENGGIPCLSVLRGLEFRETGVFRGRHRPFFPDFPNAAFLQTVGFSGRLRWGGSNQMGNPGGILSLILSVELQIPILPIKGPGDRIPVVRCRSTSRNQIEE